MKKFLIASNNQGKLFEFANILEKSGVTLITPSQVGLENLDPHESGNTFQENALLKAQAFAHKSGQTTISDDSGLCVEALDGRPGVHSKRYGNDDRHRNQKLLNELYKVHDPNRSAYFSSVICIYNPKTQKHLCKEGRVHGQISRQPKGTNGFGYDPVFIPDEIDGNKTFAQLGHDIKNKISHRARALKKISTHLKDI